MKGETVPARLPGTTAMNGDVIEVTVSDLWLFDAATVRWQCLGAGVPNYGGLGSILNAADRCNANAANDQLSLEWSHITELQRAAAGRWPMARAAAATATSSSTGRAAFGYLFGGYRRSATLIPVDTAGQCQVHPVTGSTSLLSDGAILENADGILALDYCGQCSHQRVRRSNARTY